VGLSVYIAGLQFTVNLAHLMILQTQCLDHVSSKVLYL